MQKKDQKVGNKTANKERKEGKKEDRERKIEIDSQKKTKKCKFWLLRMREKQKKLFNYVRLVGNMPFFLQNSFLAIGMIISRKRGDMAIIARVWLSFLPICYSWYLGRVVMVGCYGGFLAMKSSAYVYVCC